MSCEISWNIGMSSSRSIENPSRDASALKAS